MPGNMNVKLEMYCGRQLSILRRQFARHKFQLRTKKKVHLKCRWTT